MAPKHGYTKKSKYIGKFKIGQRFGLWTVIDATIVQRNDQGGAAILTKCDCGTEKLTSCLRLIKGDSLGCECRISGTNSHMWTGGRFVTGRYLRSIKNAAKNRDIEFSVSTDYLDSLLEAQNFKCVLSGVPIHFSYKQLSHTASLDRIDNAKGYIEGNVRWVHKHINIMKNVFDDEYFLKLCRNVYDKNRTLRKTSRISNEESTKPLFRRTRSNS